MFIIDSIRLHVYVFCLNFCADQFKFYCPLFQIIVVNVRQRKIKIKLVLKFSRQNKIIIMMIIIIVVIIIIIIY